VIPYHLIVKNVYHITMSEKTELQALSSDKPNNSAESLEPIDHALEKKVIRKCDLHLVPILFLLFLCAFVDRSVKLLPLLIPRITDALPVLTSAMLRSKASQKTSR
jgi:hypothetical protein